MVKIMDIPDPRGRGSFGKPTPAAEGTTLAVDECPAFGRDVAPRGRTR